MRALTFVMIEVLRRDGWLRRLALAVLLAVVCAIALGAAEKPEPDPDSMRMMSCDPSFLEQTYGSYWSVVWYARGCWMW